MMECHDMIEAIFGRFKPVWEMELGWLEMSGSRVQI